MKFSNFKKSRSNRIFCNRVCYASGKPVHDKNNFARDGMLSRRCNACFSTDDKFKSVRPQLPGSRSKEIVRATRQQYREIMSFLAVHHRETPA